jgi:glycosyltransferase involved in cell wall biosynthesis
MTEGQLTLNGRFLGRGSPTGVGRWAAEVASELGLLADVQRIVPRRPGSTGVSGHLWEQIALPLRCLGRPGPLLSLANWGPLAVRDQFLVIHDVAPLRRPDWFSPSYVQVSRRLLRPLARRVRFVATVSEFSRGEISDLLEVDRDRIAVLGGGVDLARFAPISPAAGSPQPPYFLFVGAHDQRKNLDHVLAFWPRVHASTGAMLVVTRRSTSTTTLSSGPKSMPWMVEVADPSDYELARLYSGSQALLWPSLYEGYGLPLLEVLACGRPFISMDTGAASELAVAGSCVLPQDADAWLDAVVRMAEAELTPVQAAIDLAGHHGWRDVAMRTVAALDTPRS